MPDFSLEQAVLDGGARCVAGIDEAGRGPLAGPVVAAAVVLDAGAIPDGIADSKKLTADRREALYADILATAHVAVVAAPPRIILERNIRGATLWAMAQAAARLGVRPDHALIDGRDLPPGLCCDGQAVIGGDDLSLSIAAASIVAKVTRDLMCPVMELCAPGYDFGRHKGYGTPGHLDALTRLGASPHHRAAFRPVAEILQSFNPVT